MIEFEGKYSTATVFSDEVDQGCASQIMGMLNSPSITNPVKIMPDFHVGKGSVIGFTMKVGEYICPNIVGVDIGCGMLTFSIKRPDMSLEEMDKKIREAVPVGFNIHDKRVLNPTKEQIELREKVGTDETRFNNSLGTLGGGNHFIEIGKGDSDDWLYVTVHSGSRKFGLDVANYHQKRAIEFCESEGIKVSKDLAFCPTEEYLHDMRIAQDYALHNRAGMMLQIEKALNTRVLSSEQCTHNYIDADNIIRKGAVRAYKGDTIILPFNRTEGIWVMEGLGNEEWNYSAPHGAGRVMSRGQAKRTLTKEQVDEEMKKSGVYSTSNPLDEAPQAYKDPKIIQKGVQETAKFLFKIKPLLNIKG